MSVIIVSPKSGPLYQVCFGTAQSQPWLSMPRLSSPRSILNQPDSPQYVPPEGGGRTEGRIGKRERERRRRRGRREGSWYLLCNACKCRFVLTRVPANPVRHSPFLPPTHNGDLVVQTLHGKCEDKSTHTFNTNCLRPPEQWCMHELARAVTIYSVTTLWPLQV